MMYRSLMTWSLKNRRPKKKTRKQMTKKMKMTKRNQRQKKNFQILKIQTCFSLMQISMKIWIWIKLKNQKMNPKLKRFDFRDFYLSKKSHSKTFVVGRKHASHNLWNKSRKRKKKTRKKKSENDAGNQMKKKHLRRDVIP